MPRRVICRCGKPADFQLHAGGARGSRLVSKIRNAPFRCHLGRLLAQRALQPFWRRLNGLSYWGLGYNNWVSRLNGEDWFAASWAETRRGQPTVVFDVGATEGDFTELLLSLLPEGRFHLFEPNPSTFARLRARYYAKPTIVLNACSVGDASGSIKLYDFADGDGSERASLLSETFSVILREDAAEVSEVEVPMTTLDHYCLTRAIDRIDLLKIDTEGFEKFVLEGACRLINEDKIDVIQLESNEQNVVSGFSIYQLQRTLPKFDIFRLLPRSLTPVVTPDLPYHSRHDIPKYCNLALFRRDAGVIPAGLA